MKYSRMMTFAVMGVFVMVGYAARYSALAATATESVADSQGNLHVPKDYRAHYQFLGSWAVAADGGKGSKEIHTVYASTGAVAQFKQLGHFPDGAVLVKEVYEADTASMTTGTVSRENTLKGWFVLVKDSKSSHPDSKLWGDGWGWSWFDAPNPDKTTSTDYKKDCLGCHVPAKSTDWIYVQGYPPLKR
jgi:hypothetical protein